MSGHNPMRSARAQTLCPLAVKNNVQDNTIPTCRVHTLQRTERDRPSVWRGPLSPVGEDEGRSVGLGTISGLRLPRRRAPPPRMRRIHELGKKNAYERSGRYLFTHPPTPGFEGESDGAICFVTLLVACQNLFSPPVQRHEQRYYPGPSLPKNGNNKPDVCQGTRGTRGKEIKMKKKIKVECEATDISEKRKLPICLNKDRSCFSTSDECAGARSTAGLRAPPGPGTRSGMGAFGVGWRRSELAAKLDQDQGPGGRETGGPAFTKTAA